MLARTVFASTRARQKAAAKMWHVGRCSSASCARAGRCDACVTSATLSHATTESSRGWIMQAISDATDARRGTAQDLRLIGRCACNKARSSLHRPLGTRLRVVKIKKDEAQRLKAIVHHSSSRFLAKVTSFISKKKNSVNLSSRQFEAIVVNRVCFLPVPQRTSGSG